jgi:anti-sigma B factor antagonist
MDVRISTAEKILHIAMEGELTIYNAAELRSHGMAILARACPGMDVRFDLAGVSEIDSAGVQLLVLLTRELQNLGLFVKVTAASRAVEETFDFVGLSEYLTEAPAWIE